MVDDDDQWLQIAVALVDRDCSLLYRAMVHLILGWLWTTGAGEPTTPPAMVLIVITTMAMMRHMEAMSDVIIV